MSEREKTGVFTSGGDAPEMNDGGAYHVAERVKEKFDFYDSKVPILGHLQRDGSSGTLNFTHFKLEDDLLEMPNVLSI